MFLLISQFSLAAQSLKHIRMEAIGASELASFIRMLTICLRIHYSIFGIMIRPVKDGMSTAKGWLQPTGSRLSQIREWKFMASQVPWSAVLLFRQTDLKRAVMGAKVGMAAKVEGMAEIQSTFKRACLSTLKPTCRYR